MDRYHGQENFAMSVISFSETSPQNQRDSRDGPCSTFAIGICVSDDALNLAFLLERLRRETFSPNLFLHRIVIIASGCSERALSHAKILAEDDHRILLVEESARRGKAEAINIIIERFNEDYLVFVNGDAIPYPGAIERLLRVITEDRNVGAVSGAPTFEAGAGMTSDALKLMWMVHNDCSSSLNHKGISNHGSDELMALRSDVVVRLPRGLVNDGGYLTGLAYARGYKIRFCKDAAVKISVPSRFSDVIGQRRRIIFGHIQVWKMLGSSPRTVESMLCRSPAAGLSILVRNIARRPGLIKSLPIVALGEVIASLAAIFDTLSSSEKHVVWKRYER
jgi:glycosyltransferase involved in cell wall biosynthesis